MKMIRYGSLIVVSFFMSWVSTSFAADPAPASAPAESEMTQGGVEVLRMVLCRDVKDRVPDQEITSAKVGDTVVGWTQIRSGMGETTVTHRWLHEAENMGDVSLTVKSSPWRTWSRKTLSAEGNWKWQVLDAQGSVLKQTAFTVTP